MENIPRKWYAVGNNFNFGYEITKNLNFIPFHLNAHSECQMLQVATHNAPHLLTPFRNREHSKLVSYFFCRSQDYNKVWHCFSLSPFYVQSRCRLHINPIAKNEKSRLFGIRALRMGPGAQKYRLFLGFNLKIKFTFAASWRFSIYEDRTYIFMH